MNNSELFMQEFDKLPKDEQFRLGVSGLFQMVQDESGGMSTGRGYGSLLGKRGRQDRQEDPLLHSDSSREMSSSISNQIQQVKITDVLTDIIQPMEDVLRRISFDNRVHQNRLHHENTMYYQGIISAVKDIGSEGSNTIFRSLYLKWQGFMRHPIWNSMLALNDYVIKPLGRLGMALMFGKREDPIQKKILKNIKAQTEFLKTGQNSPKSIAKQLIEDGVFGFAFNQAIGGVSDIFSSLFGGEDPKSEQKQTLEAIERLNQTNGIGFNILKDVDESSNEIEYGVKALPYEWLKAYANSPFGRAALMLPASLMLGVESINRSITHSGDQSIARTEDLSDQMRLLNQGIEDTQRGVLEGTVIERSLIEEQMAQRESHFARSLLEQQRTADELKEHNKREKRRTLFAGVGKLLGGGGILSLGIMKVLDILPESVETAITKGFKYVGGLMFNFVTDNFSYGQIAMGIGGALMLVPPFTKVGAILLGIGSLIEFAKYAERELGLSSLAGPDLTDVPDTDNPFFERYGSMSNSIPLSQGEGFDLVMGSVDYLKQKKRELEEEIEVARNNREGFEKSDQLIALTQQLEKLNNKIESNDFKSLISPQALSSAIDVSSGSPSSSSGYKGNGILDMIAGVESRGNYNALVYGNNTPATANLTEMTIGEVMEYQRGMVDRGHASSAVGRYQIINQTMEGLVNQIPDIDEGTQFSPDVQDKLAMELMKGRGLNSFLQGDLPVDDFADNLGKEWAALPNAVGQSQYQGIAGNRAGMSREDLITELEKFRNGSSSSAVMRYASESASNISDSARNMKDAGSRFVADTTSSAGSGVKALLDVFSGGQLGDSASGFLNDALGSIGIDMPEQEEKEVTAFISDESFRHLTSQIGRIEEALANIPGTSITIPDNFSE